MTSTVVRLTPEPPEGHVPANVQQEAIAEPQGERKAKGLPWDVRAAIFVWSLLRMPVWHLWHLDSLYGRLRTNWLPKVGSFLWAHRLAWYLTKREPMRRAEICKGCAQRRVVPAGEYCLVQVSTCACPTAKRYPFSKLPYLHRLRGWTCPIGMFKWRSADGA